MKQLLLLLRVSKPQYNEFLYSQKMVYMNPQLFFDNKSGLLSGQLDELEGSLSDGPIQLFYSTDNTKTWNYITDASHVRKDNNAYIYCMYAVTYCESNYCRQNNKFYYKVPWEYISGVWQEGYELMVIKNTKEFLGALCAAASEMMLPFQYGMVEYDLQERQKEMDYISRASVNPFLSVFHKVKDPYCVQKEFRFAIIPPNHPDHYELWLKSNTRIDVSLFTLNYGRDILIEISDLEFDADGQRIRASSAINFYESEIVH